MLSPWSLPLHMSSPVPHLCQPLPHLPTPADEISLHYSSSGARKQGNVWEVIAAR